MQADESDSKYSLKIETKMLQSYNNITTICIPHVFSKDPKCNVAVLNEGFTKSKQNEFLINIVKALDFDHHHVVIYACNDFGQNGAYDAIHPITGQLTVNYVGRWIPNSICGLMRGTMRRCKAIWMALQIGLFPPTPKPEIIVAHLDPISLPTLVWLSGCKTMYIHQFPDKENYHELSNLTTTDNFNALSVSYANLVLVENKLLKEIFKRSFPAYEHIAVLYPHRNPEEMIADKVKMEEIVPNIPEDSILFVVFGDYKQSTNFELVLDALDSIHIYTAGNLTHKIHIVLAGNCDNLHPGSLVYYAYLVERTEKTVYKNQVTFLKQSTPAIRKTLLGLCVAIIHPTMNDVYPGPILEAMSLRCAIIATNTGFAKDVLENTRTGLLTDPRPIKFSEAMCMLISDVDFRESIASLAYHKFMGEYSCQKFRQNLEELLWKVKRLT